ncbi:hypothetical protein [Qipengyuania sp. YIM B01966]|uniref:hypothetical protein n=1 Tax=Qipengyuania sp. YIM B01966 TaxID=2778646 RepID=UPI0018F4C5CD|nr:hypothetical protein [Qipengyuania sp. YIM B01966]
MSRQLAISAAFSVLAMAALVLAGTPSAMPGAGHQGSTNPLGNWAPSAIIR